VAAEEHTAGIASGSNWMAASSASYILGVAADVAGVADAADAAGAADAADAAGAAGAAGAADAADAGAADVGATYMTDSHSGAE
jgi:selenocysteine lyase/cysteine desulfurase